ncbi:hypothetical protein BH11PLA2_BH11PLA2_32180 [soil metagenome]
MKLASKLTLGLMVATAAVSLGIAWAQSPAPGTSATTSASVADTNAKAALDGYAKALNEKNHEAIAASWAEDAEHISDDGVVTKGRANIAAMLKTVLTESPKLDVKFKVTTAKAIGSEVLLVDGVAEIKNGDDTDLSRFESLWVKTATGWQLSRVRELANVAAGGDSNYDRLKELEWLVGDWTADSAAYKVAFNVKWGKNKNFLVCEQSVTADGKELVTVHKILGWDPVYDSVRTWVFDSDGGFGGALLSREGNSWYESSEALTRNGGESTSNHTTKFIDDNTFEWSSTERQLDEKPLPDLKLKYTRKK